jgi:hypothetical protein
MTWNQIQVRTRIDGRKLIKKVAVWTRQNSSMTPGIVWIVTVIHKSVGEIPLARRETMTNDMTISGILVGVPPVKHLKVGVISVQIQVNRMMLHARKCFLRVTILWRIMKGTVIFLDHGTPAILQAMAQEVHLVILPVHHRNYLIH